MSEDNELQVVDFGDAMEETKACSPLPMYIDNLFGYGSESGTYPPYCPYGSG